MQPHEKKFNEMKYLKNQQHGFIKAGLNDKLAWIFGIAAQKFHSAGSKAIIKARSLAVH